VRSYTFLANFVATAVDAVLTVVGRSVALSSVFHTRWAPAVITGFCGSLSTVSTFISETRQFKQRRHAYRYVVVSLGMAQAVALLVMGLGQPFGEGSVA